MLFAAHAVCAAKGMNMDIDKAGQDVQTLGIADLFARLCLKLTDLGDFSVFDTNVSVFECAIDKCQTVFYEHNRLPFV